MIMGPRLRRLALTAHVASSVGWLGAVVAYLALAIAGLTQDGVQDARASYQSMDLVGWFVIVPLCSAALVTGLVQSLGTEWGLFRHYWIVAKLALTVVVTIVLLLHLPTVTRMAQSAAEMASSRDDFGPTRIQLAVHAVGGLLVLLTTTALSIYKPWGRTPHGRRTVSQSVRRRHTAQHAGPAQLAADTDFAGRIGVGLDRGSPTGSSWRLYVLLALIGLVLSFIVLHLAGGGMHRH